MSATDPATEPYWKQTMPKAFSKEAFQSLTPEQQAIEKKKAGCWATCCCVLIIVIVVVLLIAGGVFAAAAACTDPEVCLYSETSNYDPFEGEAVIYEGTSAVKNIDVQITRGYFVATAGSKNEAAVISSVAKADEFQEKNIFTETSGTWSSVYESDESSKGLHNCLYCRNADVDMTFDADLLEGLKIQSNFVPIEIVSGNKSRVTVAGDIDFEVQFKGGIFCAPELMATGMLKAKTVVGDITFNKTISADTIDVTSSGGNFFFGGDSISADKDVTINSYNDILIETSTLNSTTGKIEISGTSVEIKADIINAKTIDIQSTSSGIKLEGNNVITTDDIKIYSGLGASTIVPKINASNKVELLTTTNYGNYGMEVKSTVGGKVVDAFNSIQGPITFLEMVTGTESIVLKGRGTTVAKKGFETPKLIVEAGADGVFDLAYLDGTKIDEVSVIGQPLSNIRIEFECDPARKIEYSFKYTDLKGNEGKKPVYKVNGTAKPLTFVEDTSKANSVTGYKFYEAKPTGCDGASGTEVIKVTVDMTSNLGTTGAFEFSEI